MGLHPSAPFGQPWDGHGLLANRLGIRGQAGPGTAHHGPPASQSAGPGAGQQGSGLHLKTGRGYTGGARVSASCVDRRHFLVQILAFTWKVQRLRSG